MLAVSRFILDNNKASLIVTFSASKTTEQQTCSLSFEFLRVFTPENYHARYSEQAQQGQSAQKAAPMICHKKQVKLLNIEPVAKYGYRLIFDDQHSAIYSPAHLQQVFQQSDSLWQRYLIDLKNSGHSREASIDITQL